MSIMDNYCICKKGWLYDHSHAHWIAIPNWTGAEINQESCVGQAVEPTQS